LAGSDATALLKWRFASAGLGPGLYLSPFLRGTIALNKGQMQSLFCKAISEASITANCLFHWAYLDFNSGGSIH